MVSIMNVTKTEKVIKNKLGLLNLAKTLGNVTQACRTLGYSRDSFYRFKQFTRTEAMQHSKRLAVENPALKIEWKGT